MSPNKPLLYKLTIIISMVGCIMSNDNISKDLWKNLNPLSRNYEDGLELLPEYMADEKNREKAIDFVNNKLDSIRLSFIEQIKLGTLLRGIQETAQSDEYKAVCDLISKGKRFPDYYSLALSPYPQYIVESLKVFKEPNEIYGRFYGHNGKIIKYNTKDSIIRQLSKATGKNYGRSYQDWMNWWTKKGQYLKFDYDTGRYEGAPGPNPYGLLNTKENKVKKN